MKTEDRETQNMQQQQQERSRRDHLDWLSSMEADLQSHRRSSGCYSAADSSPEVDFAVGSERDDEIPSEALYRSLNLADDPESASFAADEIADDPPVYRSLSSSMTSTMGSMTTDDDDAMATWLAQPRPPLLRRQNAFADVYSQRASESWAGALRP